MLDGLIGLGGADAHAALAGFWSETRSYVLIFIGFSVVIFVHELGHFLTAKWCNVRVEKFAVGFGREIVGFTRGETRYSFNILPLGGYVKMLGQEDFEFDKSGELRVRDDPRAFSHQPVGRRMFIVSAGVAMNLLFAALVFAAAFMVGVEFPPAEVGLLMLESPAERAGLRVFDKIIAVNGRSISDYEDLRIAVVLAAPDEPLQVTLLRPDPRGGPPTTETLEIVPERRSDQNILAMGVFPRMNNTVAMILREDPRLPPERQIQVRDTILKIDGQEVTGFWDIRRRLVARKGAWADVTLRRAAGNGESPAQELSTRHRAHLVLVSTGKGQRDPGHLLGLVPRQLITHVIPDSRADLARMKNGDVLAAWGHQTAPTLPEILMSIADNAETDIPVKVVRQIGEKDTLVSLVVRPKRSGLFGSGKPAVGVDLFRQGMDRLVVADIVTQVTEDLPTPAAPLKDVMPRGSLITKVNDEPVSTWMELRERFIQLAGTDVKLTWTYEGREDSGSIHVPHTLGTTFELPPGYRITRIDGRSHIDVVKNDRELSYAAENWIGAREILSQCIGRTVEVEYRGYLDPESRKAQVRVTRDMLDTWVMRASFEVNDFLTEVPLTEVREPNPLKAAWIGVRKTYYFIENAYLTMHRMIFTRSLDLDQVAGPVGIVKAGSEVAQQDFVKLMYFLALISANLAVINFLPMPIVDGGLFVFLIIEKIKGSPISLKIQVVTQVIGLALIIGVFLFVTFQDIQRFFE